MTDYEKALTHLGYVREAMDSLYEHMAGAAEALEFEDDGPQEALQAVEREYGRMAACLEGME